eukprot:TRINITY_DN77803_c0_g1_i1.p1 TRINITY_DN77803_c0_g1~~TRINITY_DN77803_c0_g1_i1.p1  ORF type:complete len:118 (+),score=7.81 TRINITY_DN77803_c0_g1_i1:36-389(+)
MASHLDYWLAGPDHDACSAPATGPHFLKTKGLQELHEMRSDRSQRVDVVAVRVGLLQSLMPSLLDGRLRWTLQKFLDVRSDNLNCAVCALSSERLLSSALLRFRARRKAQLGKSFAG